MKRLISLLILVFALGYAFFISILPASSNLGKSSFIRSISVRAYNKDQRYEKIAEYHIWSVYCLVMFGIFKNKKSV